ncbi:MAG: rhomboid family intramembrane serine protease [Pseudomonadota bacterium]
MMEQQEKSVPIFNVPAVLLAFIGIMLGVHITRTTMINADGDLWMLINFAFIPARYALAESSVFTNPAELWTPITYSFLHGSWTHILLNSIWLLCFGSVVARRFGTLKFVLFCVIGSVFGALSHYIFHSGSIVPMIGASAVVSACMGAAVRFAFPQNGRFSPAVHDLPAQTLAQCFQNRQVVVFAVAWFAINFLFGLGGEIFTAAGQSIAWEAHVGGFLAGLFLFSYFDRNN